MRAFGDSHYRGCFDACLVRSRIFLRRIVEGRHLGRTGSYLHTPLITMAASEHRLVAQPGSHF